MLHRKISITYAIVCFLFLVDNNAILLSECPRFNLNMPCESITANNAEQITHVGTLGWGSISDLTWLRNSDSLAVATGTGVWLYSPSTPDIYPTLIVNQSGVTSVDYNPNKDTLLSTSFDQSLTLWDASSGEEIHRITQHADTTNQAKFVEQGTRIVSASNDGKIMIWDIETESPVLLTELQSVSAIAVDYSSDSSIIAVANSTDGSVILLNSVTGTIISVIESQKRSEDIRALAFNPIGSLLASVGGDGVSVWSFNDNEPVRVTLPFVGAVNSVEFSPDGSMMSYGDTDGIAYIWYPHENTIETIAELGSWITDVSFSPDSSHLAVATIDGSVLVWNIAGKSIKTETHFGHGLSVNDARFSPDNNLLVSGGEDRNTRLWDVISGAELASFTSSSSVDAVLFSPAEETLIAVGNSDGTVTLWDTISNRLVLEFGNSRVLNQSIAFDPTGGLLVSVNDGVTIWNVGNGERLITIYVDSEWPVNAVAYSHSGDTIAFATIGNGAIYLWKSLYNTAYPIILANHESSVSVIAFSPSGNLLVSGGQNILKLWDLETQQLIKTITIDSGEITDADFNTDGSLLIFSTGRNLRVLNVADQTELVMIEANFGGIRSVDFSSDDTLIATAGNDGTIQLWGILY